MKTLDKIKVYEDLSRAAASAMKAAAHYEGYSSKRIREECESIAEVICLLNELTNMLKNDIVSITYAKARKQNA